MRLFSLFAAAASLGLASFAAHASVVTFDDLAAPTASLPTFDYADLTFSTSDVCDTVEGTSLACMYVWNAGSPNSNGTNNLIFSDFGNGLSVTITRTDGALFDLLGLDMGLSWYVGDQSGAVSINGTVYSLGQGLTTLATNLFGVSAVTISGLTGTSGYWLADNLDLGGSAPVPLPAGLPLLLAGLGGLGLIARKNTGRKHS